MSIKFEAYLCENLDGRIRAINFDPTNIHTLEERSYSTKPVRSTIRVTFNSTAAFEMAAFNSTAAFGSATFNGDVGFGKAMFSGYADFVSATFKSAAAFERATFSQEVDFSKAIFSQGASFGEAIFSQNATLSEATFSQNASFWGATFSQDALFEGAIFEKELDLTRTKYKRLFIRWRSISKSNYRWKLLKNWNKICNVHYDDTAYLLSIENFKNLGFFEDADNCYYRYRIERRKQEKLPKFYQLLDWTLWLFYGYSVRPLRPLGWLFILLVAFTALYSNSWITGYIPTDAFNTSLTVSLSGTQLVENPNHPATAMVYWIFTFEKLLASLFFAMFLVSIGRTIIR